MTHFYKSKLNLILSQIV